MIISRKTDYGLILMGALKGTYASGEFVTLKDVALRYRLPSAYIEKLARKLKEAGVLASQVGKNGGYRLAQNPSSVSMQTIVDIFQKEPMMRCLHSQIPEKSCALVSVCPTRKGWYKAEMEIRKTLEKFTLDQL